MWIRSLFRCVSDFDTPQRAGQFWRRNRFSHAFERQPAGKFPRGLPALDNTDEVLWLKDSSRGHGGCASPVSRAAQGLLALLILSGSLMALPSAHAQDPTVSIAADRSRAIFNLPTTHFDLQGADFTVTRTEARDEALVVEIALAQDAMFLPAGASLTRTVTIPVGMASATLNLSPSEFTGSAEISGILTATVRDTDDYDIGNIGSAEITMRYIDTAVGVRFQYPAYAERDSDGPLDVMILAATAEGVPKPIRDLVVLFSTRDGSAVSPEDYETVSREVRFRPEDFMALNGLFVARAVETLLIKADSVDEPNESFDLLLERTPRLPAWVDFLVPSGMFCMEPCIGQVTIIDGNVSLVSIETDRPEVIFNLPTTYFDYQGPDFTVTRAGASDEALAVEIALTQDAMFLPTEASLIRTVTIPENMASATLSLPLSEFTGSAETTGILTATVRDTDNYAVGSAGAAEVEMQYIDPVVTIGFERSAYAVGEDDSTQEVAMLAETAVGVPKLTRDLMVALSDMAGSAVSPEDYEAVSSEVYFRAEDFMALDGVFVARAVETLTIRADSVAEPEENFNLLLERVAETPVWVDFVSADGMPCIGSCIEQATIIDDDGLPVVMLSLSASSIREDHGETTVEANLSHPSSVATTVVVTATAVAPATAEDFTLSGTTLMIAAGATQSTETVTITAVDNEISNAARRVKVSGVGVNALGVEDPADVDLTITDDETPALALTLSLSPRVVMEDAGATEVKVTAVLEGVPGETAMTLAMSVGGGTAEPEDYVPVIHSN